MLQFNNKYGETRNGVLQLSLWDDAILLIHQLPKGRSDYQEKLLKCLYIFRSVMVHFLGMRAQGLAKGGNEVTFTQEKAITILALLTQVVKMKESMGQSQIALFLNESLNEYIFQNLPTPDDSILFYQSPFSGRLFDAKIPTPQKKLIANILVAGKKIFLEDSKNPEAQQMFDVLIA